MSVSSVILALLASGFAVNSAGNLKEAWNKSSDSFKNSSFFSPKAKWGLNFADKLAKTVSFPLLAIDNLTGGKIQTIALRSVLDITGGKLPANGEKLDQSIAELKTETVSNFGLNTSRENVNTFESKTNVMNDQTNLTSTPDEENVQLLKNEDN